MKNRDYLKLHQSQGSCEICVPSFVKVQPGPDWDERTIMGGSYAENNNNKSRETKRFTSRSRILHGNNAAWIFPQNYSPPHIDKARTDPGDVREICEGTQRQSNIISSSFCCCWS